MFNNVLLKKKVREKCRECHNHKPQPFPDPKRKRKPTNLNKHKPNKRIKALSTMPLPIGWYGVVFVLRMPVILHKFFITLDSKNVREKSRECHNHKPQPFLDPKRKRKPTISNKHKSNKRTKSTKISSLFPKRGNRNTKLAPLSLWSLAGNP